MSATENIGDSYIVRQWLDVNYRGYINMDEDNTAETSSLSAKDVGIILFDNFITMFSMASAVGFTGHAIGLFNTGLDLLQFTTIFAMVWGFSNAGYSYMRLNDDVETNRSWTGLMSKIGINQDNKRKIVQKFDIVFLNHFSLFFLFKRVRIFR